MNTKKISSLINKIILILAWGFLTFLLIAEWQSDVVSVLFGISTVLLYSHVLFAGYYLAEKEGIKDWFIFSLFGVIYVCLIFLVRSLTDPFFWFFWLGALFFVAIGLHLSYKFKTRQIYLKEFCNYKIYIEILGILSSLFIMGNYLYFSCHHLLLAVLNLLCIIKLNITIFFKKGLYKINYQPVDIPANPLVSIVIIAYNEEQYIEKILESIKSQDYKNYEVILVDDHSKDRTVELARNFQNQIPLNIVQKDERGISRSRNFGASFAKGELILFLDADSILPGDFLSRNTKDFVEQKLAVAGFDFNAITQNQFDKFITSFYRLWLRVVQFYNPRGIGFCLMAVASLHKKILFDQTIIMSEDFDYVKRFSKIGKFRILAGSLLNISWRRFHNENRIILLLKYLFFESYRQNIGEIRKKMLSYEFGKYHKAEHKK